MRRAFAVAACATLAPLAVPAQSSPVVLDGVWVQRIVTTSIAKLPMIGKVENESRFYAVARVRQVGDALDIAVEPCWARVDGDVARVKTIVPDETVAVMGPRKRRGKITGSTVELGRAVDVLGARLNDEWRDPLPTDAEASWDEDGDGKPGVTVRIVGPIDGEVWVAQRTWNSLRGELSPDGSRILGEVRWGAQQEVLGASSVFLKANPASKPHPDASRSTFDMRRAAPSTTCEIVKRRNDALFAP